MIRSMVYCRMKLSGPRMSWARRPPWRWLQNITWNCSVSSQLSVFSTEIHTLTSARQHLYRQTIYHLSVVTRTFDQIHIYLKSTHSGHLGLLNVLRSYWLKVPRTWDCLRSLLDWELLLVSLELDRSDLTDRPTRVNFDVYQGHSITGATNMAQYISKMLHTCLKLKIVPDLAGEVSLDMTPVDFAASAIVGLCNETNIGETYHIYNRCLTYTRLFKYLTKSGFGSGSNLVSPENFTQIVTESRSEEECPLFPLKSYFQNGFPGSGVAYPNQITRTALAQIKLKYPKIGRKVICSYFNFINSLETAAKAEKWNVLGWFDPVNFFATLFLALENSIDL